MSSLSLSTYYQATGVGGPTELRRHHSRRQAFTPPFFVRSGKQTPPPQSGGGAAVEDRSGRERETERKRPREGERTGGRRFGPPVGSFNRWSKLLSNESRFRSERRSGRG
ncbi:hypothetical protein Hdeb2414_s0007g00243441 [Helianthus debilis subsp. tardiflorus]